MSQYMRISALEEPVSSLTPLISVTLAILYIYIYAYENSEINSWIENIAIYEVYSMVY